MLPGGTSVTGCETYRKEPSTNNQTKEAEYQGRNGWKASSRRELYISGLANPEWGDLEDCNRNRLIERVSEGLSNIYSVLVCTCML